ncbi:hypothetical protein BGZ60DRAFT_473813 [Tricladium varicosporioides]|nr:hypothetical protein BGZ60DRAFT_473813 [Hymenoscyphus varicosporioides]
MDNLHVLVEQGKVLYLGISDTRAWGSWQKPLIIYQGRWSVLVRNLERKIIPMARDSGMTLAPWMKGMEERRMTDQSDDEEKMSKPLAKVASENNIQFATNVFPVVGGRRVKHLQDNIQALKAKLTTEQILYLGSVKPFNTGFPSNFIGPDPKVVGKAGEVLASSSPLAFVESPKVIGYD